MCEHKSTQNARGSINLVIMSGPNDGAVFPLAQEQFVVGNCPGAQIPIEYDPDVPPEGMTVYIKESKVVFENRTTGNRETKSLGELFLLGQTWVAVYRETGKGAG